jgi:undecaprenyl diphosphate synthase
MIIPTHIAIIMDGNRRWAKRHKLAILQGHKYASDIVLEKVVEYATKKGVKYLTFWAFSTQNWNRNKNEVDGLMNIFRHALKTKIPSFIKKGVRLKVIGDIEKLPADIKTGVEKAIESTKEGKNITVIMAINYGGRDEIIRAVNNYNLKFKIHNLKLTDKNFSKLLDTKDIPDPDLIIRTGGEKRMSGFLLWQSEYSELYFTKILWPDFTEKDLDLALLDFSKRQRRFGK